MPVDPLTARVAEMLELLLQPGVSPGTIRAALELVAMSGRLNQMLDLFGQPQRDTLAMIREESTRLRVCFEQLRTSFMECYTKDVQHRS